MASSASRNAPGARLLGHFQCSLVEGQVGQSSCESGRCTPRSSPTADSDTMTSLIRNIEFDCADAYALGSFWAEVLGGVLHEDDRPEVPEVLVSTGEGSGPGLLFLAVPEGKKVKNRLHLDLQPQDRSRDEEVERLLGLGAKLVADFRKPDGTGWVVMIDIEGNEFCVERSQAERILTGDI